MADKIFVTNIARGGSISRTEIGQDRRGESYINRNIGKDLIVLQSAHEKWQGLKQRVRNELKIREIRTGWFGRKKEQGLQLSVNIAHGSRRGVPRLRRVMAHYLDKYGDSLRTLRKLERQPDGGDQKTKNAVIDVGYNYGRKLEHLKQFDATAKGMFSKAYKASENLRGLSKKAIGNVNPNLHDDMLLAQENKLLSVNSWRRKDESCGLVRNKQSRQLIRQIVASALLHHGYATAKTLKQELTKACELAERPGTSSNLSRHLVKRMSGVMEMINDGMLAADAVLKDIELRNVAALAQANLTESLAGICNTVGRSDRRECIERALFVVAAKGSLNAARTFLELLKERTGPEQMELASNTFKALMDANPKEPHYMYVPFTTKSGGIDGSLRKGLEKYREKAHFTIIDRADSDVPPNKPTKLLHGIDPHHVVLIDGHGGARVDGIVAARRTDLEELSQEARDEAILNADRLAERLEQDGLAKNHKVIRLLNCYAGGDTLYYQTDDRGGSLRPNLYDDAFAKRLAVALKNRGYRNIVVGGYPGSLGTSTFMRRKFLKGSQDGERKHLIASGLCRYFDGDGNVVPNPRNPEKAKMSSLEKDQLAADRLADGRLDFDKWEFEFPVPGKGQAGPWIPTKDEYIRSCDFYKVQLNLAKPGHCYVADLTKKSFFADTNGIAHKTPLFAVRFRNYVEENHQAGNVVDAIMDIDRLRSMRVVDNNDNGDTTVKAFKQALIKLQKTLTDIVQDNHMTELNNEIKKVLESSDLNELKTFQAGRALGEIRNAVVGQVAEYFEAFHLLLLAEPPADTDIPVVQVPSGDMKVEEEREV